MLGRAHMCQLAAPCVLASHSPSPLRRRSVVLIQVRPRYIGGVSTRVRFAPSPTGPLHLGGALSAVANRRRGEWLLLRVDDTDDEREVEGAADAIVHDLAWLGLEWDEGPVRQSSRRERHREAARAIGTEDAEGALRLGRLTLLRADGTPTYHLASVVDDNYFVITHVVRGVDHLANTEIKE